MRDIHTKALAASHVVVLPRAGRLSGVIVALIFLAVAARWSGVFRAGSVHEVLVTIFGTPFIVVALLVGLWISWLCARRDVIRVSDREVIIERRLASIALSDAVVIDRYRLTEVVVRETEVRAKGHKYLIRSVLFLDGETELARTLPLSMELARRMVESSRGWALESSEQGECASP